MPNGSGRFLALLRGINVGGNNIISKEDLKQCFEDAGMTSVKTYIQSGNILFRSSLKSKKELTSIVEKSLSECFSYKALAVIIPFAKYKKAVEAAPESWGTDDAYKHNALFTLRMTTPKKLIANLPPIKPDLEKVTEGPGVVYWSVKKSGLTKTTLMKFGSSPDYKLVTVRNHNTVFKLEKLFDEI